MQTMPKIADILIAEDNLGDVLLLENALNRTGTIFRVHYAKDGVEALTSLRCHLTRPGSERPDLVLLDYNLPLKNAAELLEEIRKDPGLPDIPVLVMSGLELTDDQVGKLGIPRERCWVKPSTMEGFVQIAKDIEAMLNGGQGALARLEGKRSWH